MPRDLIAVADAELDVFDRGTGEPVLFVQTGLTADELKPLADSQALANGYRTILYHRRGYARSSPVTGPGSIPRDADDCSALMDALGIEQAHIVGLSYSGAVALQLAAGAPDRLRTLTLIEPPPLQTPSAAQFRAANDRLLLARRERGAAAALDEFLTLVIGADWQAATERQLPGSAQQMEQDRGTFFDTDLPALLSWQFGAADARRIDCPVLHIGGSDSGPWFAEVRELIINEWLPRAEDVVIEGADHGLALTHTSAVAEAFVPFLRRHPL